MNALTSAIGRVAEAMVEPVAELIVSIVSSPNPRAALARAQKAVLADAADAAVDEALGVK